MSGILLLIPTIIIGYFFKRKHFYLNYKFSKLSGHHLYFSSAIFGFLFVSIATIIYFILVNLYIIAVCFFSDNYEAKFNFFKSIRYVFSESNFSFNVFFIYIIAIIIAWLVTWYDKALVKKIPDIHNPSIFSIISDEPTDTLLNISAFSDSNKSIGESDERIIMLTMKDRKVYIGVVSENRKEMFARFSQGSDDFEFMPLMSGYRDKDTLDLIVTTDYSEAIEKKLNITVIIKKSEILTLTKVNSDQLSKFLLSSNLLHKELMSSYTMNKRIVIKTKDDSYLLGTLSKSDYINERLLNRYPFFYFDIEKSSDDIVMLKVLFGVENIKEIYSADDIEEIFEKLIRKKTSINIEAFNLKDVP